MNTATATPTTSAAKAKPEVETIKMDDGQLVDFTGKRRMLKESTISADGKVAVRLNFRNGEFRVFTIPDALLLKCAAHGAEQKLGDEVAGLKGTDGKAEADVEDMVLAIDELMARLEAGEWNTKRDSNGLAGTSVLIRALVELYAGTRTVEQIKQFLSDKTQADKVAMRNSAKVKPIVDRIEAERAAKAGSKSNADALLAQLDVPAASGPTQQSALPSI